MMSAARIINLLDIFSNPRILNSEPDQVTSVVLATQAIPSSYCSSSRTSLQDRFAFFQLPLRDVP